MKIKQSVIKSMSEQEKKAAIELVKLFWLVTEDKYEKLRTIEGCETLTDLKATVTDGKHILALADEMGIPEKNRYINISPSLKDLKKTYLAILKHCKQLSMENNRHLLVVYVGGHGATDAEK